MLNNSVHSLESKWLTTADLFWGSLEFNMATEKKEIPRGVEQINTGQAFILDVMAIRKMSGKKRWIEMIKWEKKGLDARKQSTRTKYYLMTF